MFNIVFLQLAQSAVGFLIGKVADGALESIGSDAYKNLLEKLKGFFSYKFAGRKELAQMQENPDALVQLVAQEAASDSRFKEELESLVEQLSQVCGIEQVSAQSVRMGSVINSSVTDSDVVGNNVNDVQIGNTEGSVNIGGKTENSFRE